MPDTFFLLNYDGQPALQSGGLTYRLDVPSFDWLLTEIPAAELLDRLMAARREPFEPDPARLRAPIGSQEIWCSGVTYKRSEEARERESNNSNLYTRIYHAQRPELFFKSQGVDVVGSREPVGIRCDAHWSVPEPELVIVLNARHEVIGFTAGNDMSSRDIEGENPLYLPQAKVYERSCAVGPRLWLQPGADRYPEAAIQMDVLRGDQVIYSGETSTAQLHRTLTDLVAYLGRCRKFRHGVYLFTGTGVVPPDSFTLQAGDETHIRIAPIGELVNSVVVVGAEG